MIDIILDFIEAALFEIGEKGSESKQYPASEFRRRSPKVVTANVNLGKGNQNRRPHRRHGM